MSDKLVLEGALKCGIFNYEGTVFTIDDKPVIHSIEDFLDEPCVPIADKWTVGNLYSRVRITVERIEE